MVATWQSAASLLLVAAFGFWDLYPFPFKLWMWARYLIESPPNAIVHRWLIITGIVAALPFGLMGAAILSARRKRKHLTPPPGGGVRPSQPGATDNFGHARTLSDKECLDRYPGPFGVVIGELPTGRAGTAPLVIDPCADGPGHGMLIAGTRSGKTTSACSMLLHWLTSAVVLDPSAEMGGMLKAALCREGKTVHLLNPEVSGCGFNALDWICPDKPMAGMDVKAVISWIFPDDQKNVQTDGYFQPSGKALCVAILADLIWSDCPAAEKNLRTFRSRVVTPELEMPDFLADIHAQSKSAMARDLAGTLMKITPKQFSGVYGQAVQGTEWLSEVELADLVSGNSFQTVDIINGRTTVFAQIPLHTLEQSPGVGRVIIGSLMQAVYNARGQTTGRVLTLLDEAWCLGAMQVQKSALVAGAKSGLTLVFLYQAVGQVREIWGENGTTTLYNNLEWRAYAACRDDKTAEEVSKAFGEVSVISYSDGSNSGTQRPAGFGWGSKSSGDTSTMSEIKRRLILPQEVLDAPRDDLFVVAHGNMRLRMPVYYRRPELAAIVSPSPYYRAAAE
jgi:type IV secretion system protein VirD4